MTIQEITIKHKSYPAQLKEIAQPPQQLFIRGELPTKPMVTIIGSRRPTAYGRRVTYQLAYECARAGLVVVSGLAIGLDTVAHEAALDAGGTTVAVLAGGLDIIYPARNHQLAERIVAQRGALISEYTAGTPPLRFQFVARNRIEAGLALGVVVTEAAAKSGTLTTANFALQENRAVMAVPGNITSLLSAGPNNLLRSGAVPVTSAVDIIETLGFELPPVPTKPMAASAEEAAVLELLAAGTTTTEALLNESAFDARELAQTLSLLEIAGKIRNLGAGQWVIR